jgi:hypothetical protein
MVHHVNNANLLLIVEKAPKKEQKQEKMGICSSAELNPEEMATALKDALRIAAEKATAECLAAGGFLNNPAIHIHFPDEIRPAAEFIEKLPFCGDKVKELEEKMNRAAEAASAKAIAVFKQAISAMTFTEAKKILQGADNAATEYFRTVTRGELYTQYSPIVRAEAEKLEVIQKFDSVMNKVPDSLKGNLVFIDYVVNKALDGIFVVMEKFEKDIRTNPAARTTTLLQRAFLSKV